MKAPDKHIIDRTLNNTATPEEARQVIRWFSTPEGSRYLSSLMDEDMEKIQPGSEELYAERSIPSDEMYQYIMKRIHLRKRKQMLFRAAASFHCYYSSVNSGILINVSTCLPTPATKRYMSPKANACN